MKIADLPIPDIVKEKLKEEGITTLYPPQAKAIDKGLLKGNNLVVAIPTASGKTLLAILACIKNLTDTGLKTLYLSPLRALAFEKYNEFKNYLDPLNKRTILLTGDYDAEDSSAKYADVIIATNEKIDSAIRHQAKWINKIGLIVSDEVHLINDSSRGPTLEVVLALLRQVTNAQLLALSATIHNADQIARWLQAELVSSDWRPVELKEGVLFDKTIVYGDGSELTIPLKYKDSFNNLISFILSQKSQCLVFATTRNMAESTAKKLAAKVSKTLTKDELERLNMASSEILNTGEQSKQSRGLAQLVRQGVSYHHAGLNSIQRRIVERNFKQGNIKIISATPTLCMSGDTNIWNGIQEINIKKITKQQIVDVLNGVKTIPIKIQEINENSNDKNLLEIRTVSGYSIKLTPNHKILIKRDSKRYTIPIKDVRKSDKIATIRQIIVSNPKKVKFGYFIKENQSDFSNQIIDENTSYFIGLMLGDGYSGSELSEDGIIYKGSSSIVSKDQEILDTVQNFGKKFNLNCKKMKNSYGNSQIIISKTKWFREFLARVGIVKGADKHISDILMEMEDKNIKNLLMGLFDSDGFVNSSRSIGFSNTSIKLIVQVQKLLLRFGIVSRIRERKASKIRIHSKEYKTKKSYELIIGNKKGITTFHDKINFNLSRKQEALKKIVNKIRSNVLYTYCPKCEYKIYRDLFTGRTEDSKKWGEQKYKIINLLGTNKELGSRNIKLKLGFEPKKKVSRLNHHYELIKKRRIGKISPSEWFWSLNDIGNWIYRNIIESEKSLNMFFNRKTCPLCKANLENNLYKGWREFDYEGDIYWDFIKSIKQVSPEDRVFDLILPSKPTNDHLFIANGLFVHNSAGVNLPARYVIIKSIYRYDVTLGSYPIPVLEYKQQSGRAGRPQYDKQGDAILIAKNEYDATSLFQTYVTADTEDIESRIATEPSLRKIVLGQIATENTQTMEELQNFIGQTFYGHQQDPASLSSILSKVVKFLREEGLIIQDPDYLLATSFGKRVSQLYIDPLGAIVIREGLMTAKRKSSHFLKDISYLHLVCSTPDVRFVNIRKDEQIDVINFITDHEEEFLTPPPENSFELELFMSRVKTALILQDWIKETPEETMLDRYNVGSGDIYMVVSNSEWLLYASTELAKLLNYEDIAESISSLHNRVVSGIKEELLELVTIPNIGRVRARILYDKGYKTRKILKQTDPNEILKIPGFGKELVKGIYTNLLGDDFKLTDLKDDPSVKEQEDKTYVIPQKQLDDFF